MNIVECNPALKMNQLLREMSRLQNGMNIIQFMVGNYTKQFYVLFINIHIVSGSL